MKLKHNEIRERELRKLAKSMASQFGLKNPLDIQSLEEELVAKYDNGSRLTSQYETSPMASSSKFRADVRNVIIDLIATYGHIETIDKEYAEVEGYMRTIVNQYTIQLEDIMSSVVNSDKDNIRVIQGKDLFTKSEETTGLEYIHGRIRPGTERVSQNKLVSSSMSYEVYPDTDNNNGVLKTTTGNIKSIIQSGLASKTWSLDVYTEQVPNYGIRVSTIEGSTNKALDINNNLSGIVLKLDLDFSTAPIRADEMEIRFQQPVRILGMFANGDAVIDSVSGRPITTFTEKRDHLLPILGSTKDMSSLSIYVHQPQFTDKTPYEEILADQYDSREVYAGAMLNPDGLMSEINKPDYFHYEIGIYNIKFRNILGGIGLLKTSVFNTFNGALDDAFILHMGNRIPDSYITKYYVLPDGTSTITKPLEPQVEHETFYDIEDTSALVLSDTPWITNLNRVDVYITTPPDPESPSEEDEITHVDFLYTAPGVMPQFNPNDIQECFLIGPTLVFKNAITLDKARGAYLTVSYPKLLNGVQFEIGYPFSDCWTDAYTVVLHDHKQ